MCTASRSAGVRVVDALQRSVRTHGQTGCVLPRNHQPVFRVLVDARVGRGKTRTHAVMDGLAVHFAGTWFDVPAIDGPRIYARERHALVRGTGLFGFYLLRNFRSG